jgi:C-terminal processing protease CtpA/Prc
MPHRKDMVFAVGLILLPLVFLKAQQSAVPTQLAPGAISKLDRERALGILDNLSKGIQDNYYDPKLSGVNWDAAIANAKIKIAQANSLNDALAQVAVAVSALNDSHTTFRPPHRPFSLDFGFQYQMFWSRCFITHVKSGSDAEVKGLKPGQELLTIDGVSPHRQNLWSIEYLNYVLDPRPEMMLEVQGPSEDKRKLVVEAKVTPMSDLAYRPGAGILYDMIRKDENLEHLMRMQWVQIGDVVILKFPWFYYNADTFYVLGDKIRKAKALMVDVRGDSGGAEETLSYFVGMFFDKDLKMFDRVQRKKTVPQIAKREHHIYFPGKLIVLVDSESASAAERFARIMQLEKRGTVVGDRSSGLVMEASNFDFFSSGVDYGAEITIANLIMADGKSLEHRGVNPDETLFPDPSDLAAGRDPVLAHAAQELGVELTPEVAGKLFPYEWPKD